MLVCDLCNKPIIQGKTLWVEKALGADGEKKQVCEPCIILCKEIVNNKNITDDIVYLNEYKELKEQGKV